MKIIKNILQANAGKLALSAMQTLGIGTAVAVAGVGAYFALSPQQEVNPDTVFSSYDNENVVYVAGHSAAGGYAGVGVAPEEGGEIKSGFQAKLSHSLRLMNEESVKPELLEVQEQEQDVASYKMDGATEGLGVAAGQQGATAMGMEGMGDMSAIQAQIAALQANAKAQQEQAAAAAAAAGANAGDAMAAAQAAMAKAQGKWGKNADMASAAGSNLGAEGLRAGSHDGSAQGGAGSAGGSQTGEGQRIQSSLPPSSGNAQALFNGNVDWRAGRNTGGMDVNSLTAMAKHSAAIATKGGDASDVFMAGEGQGGGIALTGGVVTTGGGASDDFSGDSQVAALSGLVSDLQSEAEEYEEARKKLQKSVNMFGLGCLGASFTSVLGYISASGAYVNIKREINRFKQEWAEKSFNGYGGARYDQYWYWKKAQHVADSVYWSIAGGPVAVGLAWGITSAQAWGKGDIDMEDLEGPVYNISDPYGERTHRAEDAYEVDEE